MSFMHFPSNRRFYSLVGYSIGLLLGLITFHILFDASIFLNLFWGLDKPNDLMQHIAGFYAFRNSPWGMPLLYTNILGAPDGVSIFFTDSIPLMALLFKLISPFLSADFHYFKLWVLLSFLLQPVAAIYLLRSFGHREVGAAFFAAAFSLLIKWFIFRTGHPALCGQFVILFAIAYYVQQTHSSHTTRDLKLLAIKWLCLICVSFLIHLYLFVMVVAIYIAAVLDFHFVESKKISLLFYKLNLLLIPCLLLPILYTVLISSESFLDVPATEGYGYFSLNLTGPIYGGNLIFLPKTLGPTTGQTYEDQSYLGLGLILLILLGLFLGRKTIFTALQKYPFLILLILGFFIFSLSTDIYLGNKLIYRYPGQWTARILASPISQFRASARFFWPIGYVLLFFSLAKILKRGWALPVLACLLVIQWIDLPKPYIPRPEGYTDAYNIDFSFWDQLLKAKRSLYIYPPLSCGGDSFHVNIPVLMIAAKNGVTSNTVFVTRYTEDCDQKLSSALADISPNTVHIFPSPVKNKQGQQVLKSFDRNWCAGREEITICVPYPTETDRVLFKQVDNLVLNTKSPLNYP